MPEAVVPASGGPSGRPVPVDGRRPVGRRDASAPVGLQVPELVRVRDDPDPGDLLVEDVERDGELDPPVLGEDPAGLAVDRHESTDVVGATLRGDADEEATGLVLAGD